MLIYTTNLTRLRLMGVLRVRMLASPQVLSCRLLEIAKIPILCRSNALVLRVPMDITQRMVVVIYHLLRHLLCRTLLRLLLRGANLGSCCMLTSREQGTCGSCL